MKKLIIIISILFSVAYGQTCDTVTNLTFSLVTTSTARVTWTHATNKISYNWALYCLSGCGGTAQQTGTTAGNTLNLSGLNSSFAYQFCITTYCGATSSTPKCSNFTTLSPQIQYTPMTAAGYQYKYVKIDTGFNLPFQDTTLKRGTTRPGAVVCNTADSNVYAYNGSYWELLQGVNSSSNKVDSVIVSPDGDSLFYWINGTSYGQVFQNTSWRITGNASTTAGTNFIGTTDSVRLDLRTNNTIRQSITGSGNVGIGTVTPQRKFEVNGTMYLVDEFTHYNQFINGGNSSAYGYYNVVNGFEGLKAVTSGSHNMAMGANSLILNTTGSNNIAIGYLSLGTNVSGSQNIAIGSGAGRYNTLSNRLYINSLVHTNILDDTTKSIIYGYQDATASNQRLYLNSQLYLPYAASGVGTKALRINPSTGIVTYADTTAGGGSGVTTAAAIGSSPNANGLTISGSNINLQPASASYGGALNTVAQTIAGNKTFADSLTVETTIAASSVLSLKSNAALYSSGDITWLRTYSKNNQNKVPRFNIGSVYYPNVNPTPGNGDSANQVGFFGWNCDSRGSVIDTSKAAWVYRNELNYQRVAWDTTMQSEFGIDWASPNRYGKSFRLFAMEPEFSGKNIRTYITATDFQIKDTNNLYYFNVTPGSINLSGRIGVGNAPQINLGGTMSDNSLNTVLKYNTKDVITANVTGGASNIVYFGRDFSTAYLNPSTNVIIGGTNLEVTPNAVFYNNIRMYDYKPIQIQNTGGSTFTELGNGYLENYQNQVLRLNRDGYGVIFSKISTANRQYVGLVSGVRFYNTTTNKDNVYNGSQYLTPVYEDTLGKVGIGTGSPSAALHIVPASASIAPLLLNAVSGFTGNLIDAKVNGVSKFIVDKDGSLTANSINSTKINYNNIIGGISGTASTFAIYNNATSYSTEFQIHGSAEASGAGISLPSGYLLINGATVAPSAIADLQSTTKGFLPPRMTATQGSAISSPAEGLLIYVTNTNGTFTAKGWWGYDGAAWQKLNN